MLALIGRRKVVQMWGITIIVGILVLLVQRVSGVILGILTKIGSIVK